jgi:hypothetical protein
VASDLLLKDEILEVINIAQTNADFQDVLENLQPLNDWAKEQYTKILEGNFSKLVQPYSKSYNLWKRLCVR